VRRQDESLRIIDVELAARVDARREDMIAGELLCAEAGRRTGGAGGPEPLDTTPQVAAEREGSWPTVTTSLASLAAGVPAVSIAPALRALERDLKTLEAQVRAKRPTWPKSPRSARRCCSGPRTGGKTCAVRRVGARLVLRRLVGAIVLFEPAPGYVAKNSEGVVEWTVPRRRPV